MLPLPRLAPLHALLIALAAAGPHWQPTPPAGLRALAAAATRGGHGGGYSPVESRRLEKRCDAVSLRLLPPPSYTNYHTCFNEKLHENSSHDWSVPGAKIDAEIDCWCANNLTNTINEYGCCNHRDIYPMCTIDCTPDCDSTLARQCQDSCPSMCFEAAEYVVDEGLCTGCRWADCWPVLKCLTDHAKQRVQENDLNRTCDETAFVAGTHLDEYRKCWLHAPKHSSHWNVMSSVIYCICREDMRQHTEDTHCCKSMLYGRGVCVLDCLDEGECYSQEGQTCIHRCQRLCAAFDIAPGQDCIEQCLGRGAPCRKYASCPTPPVSTHVCDDGRWPEASSGCCESDHNGGTILGCPKLCEAQHIWRLDGGRAIPWWTRWQPGPGIIYQCSCEGCPQSTQEGMTKMQRTLQDTVWDNGQMMLIDIARREGLTHGPNRKMQELMLQRNEMILKAIKGDGGSLANLDGTTAAINAKYIEQITEAARMYGDEPLDEFSQYTEKEKEEEKKSYIAFSVILGVCTLVIVVTIGVATSRILQKRREIGSTVSNFGQNPQVVIGNPVPPNPSDPAAVAGEPVVVSAGSAMARKDNAKDVS